MVAVSSRLAIFFVPPLPVNLRFRSTQAPASVLSSALPAAATRTPPRGVDTQTTWARSRPSLGSRAPARADEAEAVCVKIDGHGCALEVERARKLQEHVVSAHGSCRSA